MDLYQSEFEIWDFLFAKNQISSSLRYINLGITLPFDSKKLKTFPDYPGVYLMKGEGGEVLYVGKANNLRQRVRQYFLRGGDGRVMIPYLLSKVEEIDTVVVTSEKEALLLENNLIKEHQPRYNALLKDDKSYVALKVTRHEWPRIDVVRYRGKPKADGLYFGPYAHAGSARRTLDLLHKMFPLRQCSDQEFARRTRPCILYDIKKCVAPCVRLCSKEEYGALVNRAIKFLKGQDREIIKELYQEMKTHADKLEFERAGELLEIIQHIEKTIEGQRVDRPLGMDADVIGIFREGDEVGVAVMDFRSGRLTGVHHYSFRSIAEEDEELIETFLVQRYRGLRELPHEILIPFEVKGSEAISELLSEQGSRKVSVHAPQRGDKVKMIEMALLNAEALFKKGKEEGERRERTLLEMQERFHLTRYPKRIACFDISTNLGAETVATMVVFTNGEKDSSSYRKYTIRSIDRSDDYGAMREALTRRFKRAQMENDLPDLLVIDGGKGHLNVALQVLKEFNLISVDVIALAKEEGRHDKGQSSETVFVPHLKDPIAFSRHSPILFLLQKIRDEAHRTALAFHRLRRSKATVKSALDEIPGIGPVKRKKLLKHFGSLKKVAEASLEELAQIPGISNKDAQSILKFLQ